MTATAALASALGYYARIGAALFPIPHGAKSPVGIVESFARDYSCDAAQWDAWHVAHNCNFGIVAGPSRLIIVDIDTATGRDAAWSAWCELCATWGIAPPTPQIQSARGGWHVYFSLPHDVDAGALRQPDAIKGKINIRAGNGFTVAAGSYYDGTAKGEASGHYVMLCDAAPYPAPSALIEHCTRTPVVATAAAPILPGSRDAGDVAALLTWLAERGAFANYEDWFQCGMALKIEYGDAGLDLWRLTHDDTVTADVEATKWQSFATDVTAQSVTLNTFLQRAHSLGWRGTVRKSTSAMFDSVAQLAANAGASLASQGATAPLPPGTDALFAGQAELTRLGSPILEEFLASTSEAPAFPIADDFPMLPATMEGHGLYTLMNQCLTRIAAMIEPPQKFRAGRVIEPLGVLGALNLPELSAAVHRRITMLGHTLNERKIKLAKERIGEAVERVTVTLDKWEYDPRTGQIENDNSDNVQVLLGVLGLSVRWNAWFERMEIQGGTDSLRWSEWTYIDDPVIAKIRTRANRTKTRFRPAKEFLWESLLTIAHENAVDPVRDLLAALETEWDRTPRLATWLTRYCGTPCDPYHQAVGCNIIGGIVSRAREPGIKFDTMAVFYGGQGTGKSTLAEILALDPKWFTDSILLGDASKELVLSLAGKLVAEIGEMGMRSNTDASHVKAMISRQVDEGRTAYARAVSRRERRNIFIGTANDDTPLQDPTGNRRFLPVRVTDEIDLIALRADIRQIIGEAAAQHTAGRSFDIPRDVWPLASAYQDAAREISHVEELCLEWFDRPQGSYYITANDVTRALQMAGCKARYAGHMRKLGWRPEIIVVPPENRKIRVWIKHPNNHITECTRLEPAQNQAVPNARVEMRAKMNLAPPMQPPPL